MKDKNKNNKIKIIENVIINELLDKEITNIVSLSEHKCYWVNQKGEPCPWNSLSAEKNYCKRHSIYEDIFNKDDISSLSKCSGCKNMFKNDADSKQCLTCRTRYEKNKKPEVENIKKQCLGLTQNHSQCSFEPLINDNYCEKHQSYKKWKELIDEGLNVCRNWIKGCFEIINDDKKSCLKCRIVKKNIIIINNNVINELETEKIKDKNVIIADKETNTKLNNNFKIIESFNGHKVTMGKTSGTIYNAYYKVYDINDVNKIHFYAMKCSDDSVFYFSDKSKIYVIGKTWFRMKNGYISTMIKKEDDKVGLYLHQLVAKT